MKISKHPEARDKWVGLNLASVINVSFIVSD